MTITKPLFVAGLLAATALCWAQVTPPAVEAASALETAAPSTVPALAPSALTTYQTPSLSPLPTAPATTEMPAVESSRALRLGATDETVLPLTLPGYELRVLDITKKITYDVAGTPVVAELPIFVYLPRTPETLNQSKQDLRKIYSDLISLYDQDKVDRESVRSMLKRLDKVIDSFDATPADIGGTKAPTTL